MCLVSTPFRPSQRSAGGFAFAGKFPGRKFLSDNWLTAFAVKRNRLEIFFPAEDVSKKREASYCN